MGHLQCVFNGMGLQRVGGSGARLEKVRKLLWWSPGVQGSGLELQVAVVRWDGKEKSVLERWMVDSLYLATAQMGEIRKRAMLTSRTIREDFLSSKGSGNELEENLEIRLISSF